MSDQQWHMRQVATLRDGKAGPAHETWQEGLHEQSGATGSGNQLEHVPATDDDLKRFMRAYNSPHMPLQEWINDTCNARDLDEQEKARLHRIAEEVEAEKQQS